MPHQHHVTIYYEDTDAGGVVYYANYLKFAERARTEWLRSGGHNQSALWKKQGIGFVVRRCTLELHRPARLDDVLRIETRLHERKRASMTMQQSFYRNDEHIAELLVTLACVTQEFRPCRLPDILPE